MTTKQALGCRRSHSKLAGEVFVGEEPQPASLCRSLYRKVAAGIRVGNTAYVLSCATNSCVGMEDQ